MLDRLYNLGRYALQINYAQAPPDPQLAATDAD
jgi:hypothetical protein